MADAVSPALFVVFAEPSPEREAEFHHWYDHVHGPDAIENGSFNALHRYRAAGPGWRQARYLALWEGDYGGEREAWAYIRPRAEELKAAGRVGDVASVVWALMMFSVPAPSPAPAGRTRVDGSAPASLVTVQNDWRHPDPDRTAADWWKASGLEDTPAFLRARLCTSDPDGGGGGYHLALFDVASPAAEAVAGWAPLGTPGTSPTPPYRTIFVSEADSTAAPTAPGPTAPHPADDWVMEWDHVATLTGSTRTR
jgi:hypothetical protein